VAGGVEVEGGERGSREEVRGSSEEVRVKSEEEEVLRFKLLILNSELEPRTSSLAPPPVRPRNPESQKRTLLFLAK
jgi:hypothetical protein